MVYHVEVHVDFSSMITLWARRPSPPIVKWTWTVLAFFNQGEITEMQWSRAFSLGCEVAHLRLQNRKMFRTRKKTKNPRFWNLDRELLFLKWWEFASLRQNWDENLKENDACKHLVHSLIHLTQTLILAQALSYLDKTCNSSLQHLAYVYGILEQCKKPQLNCISKSKLSLHYLYIWNMKLYTHVRGHLRLLSGPKPCVDLP